VTVLLSFEDGERQAITFSSREVSPGDGPRDGPRREAVLIAHPGSMEGFLIAGVDTAARLRVTTGTSYVTMPASDLPQLVSTQPVMVIAPVPSSDRRCRITVAAFRPDRARLVKDQESIRLTNPEWVQSRIIPPRRKVGDVVRFAVLLPLTFAVDLVALPVHALLAATGSAHVGPFPFLEPDVP
jgi:hypothetical protein